MTESPSVRPLGTARRRLMGSLLLLSTAVSFAPCPAAGPEFDRDVLPILHKHCLDCHGSDTAESGLRLDSPDAALRGGDSGEKVIVPGNAVGSYLIERITHADPARRMPPDSPPLSEQEIAVLKNWIADGPSWADATGRLASARVRHWSFEPVTKPALPPGGNAHPIDAFIEDKLRMSGLTMSGPADRRRLIRRLFLVMHGLPPSPEQVEAFVQDSRPDAWETLVEGVLGSPHYGERMATFWLDLVRFGETHGFETNRERPHAWRYRDWVIAAFNDDKPYRQFVLEQIAGDATGADVGTGFLVAGPYDLVKGQDELLRLVQRQDELADMINTTGTAFLGLTLGCARCHNHKFDPITQTDYYGLQAVFAGVNHADRVLPLPEETQASIRAIDRESSELKEELAPFIRRTRLAHLLVDDQDLIGPSPVGIEYLVAPAGTGKNPPGADRGFSGDSGSTEHSANLSRGEYTWWKNAPGCDFAVYRPLAQGTYRIWISWGCGWDSHSQDARYLLDTDGDVTTSADRIELTTVNQQRFADGTGDVPGKSLWSGFLNAGTHTLTSRHAIVLQGGTTGTAVTADVLLLEPVIDERPGSEPVKPGFRPAVNARTNVEDFAPAAAKFVRFTILATNQGQPCLDELEIYSGERNAALASHGARPSSSGDFVHPLHKLEQINDGQHGNSRSWIAAVERGGWVQIELPEIVAINRIVWGRDHEGKYADRVPIEYRIDVSTDGEQWTRVASSADRLPFRTDSTSPPEYDFAGFPEVEAQRGRAALSRLQELTARREQLAQPISAYAGTFSQPGKTFRLYRGEPGSPREEVVPGGIRRLTDLQLAADSPEQQRRLALAHWIANDDNPLTARVMANRIWQFHFGSGIVDTPSDFGANGTPPSHPELLDWLAKEFTDNGWSIKHLHRQILLSQTWRQDSAPRPEGLSADADSRLLWRFPPRRLEAEGIRDSMLAVTGTLDRRVGGPGFNGFEVEAENVRHYFPKTSYGPEDWRRMIYMTKVRQERESVFGIFDCPDASQVVPKRSRSTTPLQALNLLNSRFVLQQSSALVERLQREATTPAEQVIRAYELCYGRPPTGEESAAALEFIAAVDWNQFARALLNSNEFVFIP